jgi:hypothetical protein
VTVSSALRPRIVSSFASSGIWSSIFLSFVSSGRPTSAARRPGSGSRSSSSRSTANCGWLIWCSPIVPVIDSPTMSPAWVISRPSIGRS